LFHSLGNLYPVSIDRPLLRYTQLLLLLPPLSDKFPRSFYVVNIAILKISTREHSNATPTNYTI
jgi:hypothetical protein